MGQSELLGFAFPTHRWSIPSLVDEFVQRARFVTFSGEHCTERLRCLHYRPQDASQHGKVTEGRKRYLNPVLEG